MATEADFTYDEATFEVTDEILKAFKEHGYIVLRGLFSPEELKKIKSVLEDTDLVPKYGYGVSAYSMS